MSQPLEAGRRVAAVVTSSVVFGVFDRALGHVWRATHGSAAAATALRVVTAWRGLDSPRRRFAVGTLLVVAVATHLLLTLATQVPPGWIWLILPGLVSAAGLLTIAASGVRAARD